MIYFYKNYIIYNYFLFIIIYHCFDLKFIKYVNFYFILIIITKLISNNNCILL